MHLLSQDSAPFHARLLVTQVDHDSTLAEVHLTHVAVDTHVLGMNQLQAPPAIPSLRLPDVHGTWPVLCLLLVALQPPHLLLTPAESLDFIRIQILTALSGSSLTAHVGALDGAEMAACSVL